MTRGNSKSRSWPDEAVRVAQRTAKQVAIVLVILLTLALLTRVIPQKQVYSLAALVVVALAFLTGLKLVLESTQAAIAWLIACGVVPCYLLLLGLVGPNETEKFIDVAYLFGSLYGAVAGGVGVLVGLVVRRRRSQAKGN